MRIAPADSKAAFTFTDAPARAVKAEPAAKRTFPDSPKSSVAASTRSVPCTFGQAIPDCRQSAPLRMVTRP